MKLISTIIFILMSNFSSADFFEDISGSIKNNQKRLSYGISVTDFNKDGKFEFIVTGFKFPNLILSHKNGYLENINTNNLFADQTRSTIGVAACDIDNDGFEELYFLNTDTYSGQKQFSDRLLDNNKNIIDLFQLDKNLRSLNLTAGRSVVCVDRNGDGKYGIYVANYGGPTRFYELKKGSIVDQAPLLKINRITGGRAVVAGHILSNYMDIFAANERGPNFLYKNENSTYKDVAKTLGVEDTFENGRGTTLTDFLYRGKLDIVSGNWNGEHRIFLNNKNKFNDIANSEFKIPSRVRTIISADFDNDGFDEIFVNNIGEPNKLFKILSDGELKQIQLSNGLEPLGLGTGAAVADIDNDGILELLVSHGESGLQPLSLYKANIKKPFKFLRILPKTTFDAPARGATVILNTNIRNHAKTIDAGSGYLCQMEPVAHYGLRNGEKVNSVTIKWTDGSSDNFNIDELNKTYIFRKGI
ncbi:MAG: hypothetical protein CBD59_00165 [Alphaproteobacteria bacterium TMED199]|nr:MAG: hypothetical protein CBD59_00165 [Alphaproteobacteria bacterium TMED199]